MIPLERYFREDVLSEEIESIFRRGWFFISLTESLSNNRDFVCVSLPGEEIVVQNFSGEIRAFQNVCTHRMNRIQYGECGNRPLSCRYHGWTFDQDGLPLSVSARQRFGENLQKSDFRLRRYRVAICGRFVFVSLNEDSSSLKDYLGDFYTELESISGYLGDKIDSREIDHEANWKLLVENVLECYHCSIVHPETFGTALGVGQIPLENIKFSGKHSSCHFPRKDTDREHLRKKLIKHLEMRQFQHNSFFHIFIFPNLFISSTEGVAFYVGQILPIDAGNTLLKSSFFEPAVELNAKQRVTQDAINSQGVALGLRVIGEDRVILENVQRGVRACSDRTPVLGIEELRIRAFMDAYTATLAGEPYVPPANIMTTGAEAA